MTFKQGQKVLGRYVIEERIGLGGMGEVYRATHESLEMPVAIKTLTVFDNSEYRARFEREALIMAKLRHPNLAAILDYGIVNDVPCIAMEFISGGDVSELLQRAGGSLEWMRAVDLCRGVLRGLAAIHRAGMVHRDMKPSNVMLLADDDEAVKVVDFGIARPIDPESLKLTATGLAVGTPAYMAPEQLVGHAAVAQSDLYATGLILFELLSGALPFGGTMRDIIRRAGEVPAPPVAPRNRSLLPAGLGAFFVRALALEPADRFESAVEMSDALRKAVEARAAVASSGIVRPAKVDRNQAFEATGAFEPPVQAHAETMATPQPALEVRSEKPTEQMWEEASEPIAPRYVFAASLPPSVLKRKTERRYLSEALGRSHRSFMFGGRFWLGVILTSTSEEARDVIERLEAALETRFAEVVAFDYRAVADSFELSAASLSGLQPLPAELEDMLADLA